MTGTEQYPARFVVHGDARKVLINAETNAFAQVITELDGTRAIYIDDDKDAEAFRKLIKARAERSGRQPITDEGFYQPPAEVRADTPSPRRATVANAGAKRE